VKSKGSIRRSQAWIGRWIGPGAPWGLIAGLGLVWLQAVAAQETVMEMIPLRNRPAAEIQPLLMPLLEANEVVTGNGFDLIVKASPARLQEIGQLIQQLDKPQRNLLVSVLQSSYKTAEQLNAEAAIAVYPNAIRMQGMVGDTRDAGEQRAMQQLRTLEGQPARIEIGQLRPYEYVTIYDSGFGYPGVTSGTQFQQASTGFAVIPRLQANDEIMLDIAPWAERFRHGGRIDSQSAHTSVRARLGEWIEIGGIAERQQADQRGLSAWNYSTQNRATRILVKIDLAN